VSEAPRVAIVIPTRNRPQLLEGALTAVEAVLRPGDEAIVVDSASTDPAVRQVVAAHSSFTYVRCELPGTSRARNRGFRASTAPIVAFTDDDCRPRPGWVDALEAAFHGQPRLGLVTGRVEPDRRAGPLLSVGGGSEPYTFEYGVDPATIGHGANFAARRAALDTVSGFDELLGAGAPLIGAEDPDLFWRMLRAGWVGRYEPAAEVVHCQWRTKREYLETQYSYGHGGGAFGLKVVRLDRAAGRRILKDGLWRRGAAPTARNLWKGNQMAAAGSAVRAAASVVGAFRGWRTPLDGDRYTSA
jgi:glycosyltransferase involved in cell wall biosynthesis